MSRDLRALVTAHAADVGLSTLRFAAYAPPPDAAAYRAWLELGHHADMDYLRSGADVRCNPAERMPSTRSVLVIGLRHDHERPPDPGDAFGLVARYAWGRDYHNLFGKRLKRLLKRLRTEGIGCWGGVDTAPILERMWARLAGLGFVGKNTLLIQPGQTSWLFLGVVFLDVDITPDPPLVRDHCGRCTRCLVGCPTDAFLGPYQLDARRCIAYWTIEARSLPPRALRPGFGRWVFGCDVCQEVCPHNHGPPPPDDDDLRPRHAWLDLPELLQTPDELVLERFTGTPLRRPGADGLKRNALIALANLGDDKHVPLVREQLAHPAPMVRAAAVWCLQSLGDAHWAQHRDDDPLVQAELSPQPATSCSSAPAPDAP